MADEEDTGVEGPSPSDIRPVSLIDEILNSVLFLLIGLEVLVLRLDPSFGWLAAIAVLPRCVQIPAPHTGEQAHVGARISSTLNCTGYGV